MDPAARFIAANALKDLSQFTLNRETMHFTAPEDPDSTAFYVIDFDPRRNLSLDTFTCTGPSVTAADRSETLNNLFKQVLNLTTFNPKFFETC